MWYVLVALGIMGCAIQAIRVQRLLNSAIWLAGASALVALFLYMLGAPEVAVIELSVGAGLVTVLFVFAINIAGEEELPNLPLLPRWLGLSLVIVNAALFILLNLPAFSVELALSQAGGGNFFVTLWEVRGLDILLQIILIYGGVWGVLALLTEDKLHPRKEKSP